MKINSEIKTTTNSKIFRRIYLRPYLGCIICARNRGCNKRYKYKVNPYRSWKTYRETQWK